MGNGKAEEKTVMSSLKRITSCDEYCFEDLKK